MRYNVAQLLKEPTGSSRIYELNETFTDAERELDRVQGPVHLIRTHQGILVTATLEIQTTLACIRCLGEYKRSSAIIVEEEFFPSRDISTGRSLPPPPDADDALRIDPNHALDMTETVRQYVIADAPMKPLCREECQGLCPVCGTNLNRLTCSCVTVHPSSPQGSLASLFNVQNH